MLVKLDNKYINTPNEKQERLMLHALTWKLNNCEILYWRAPFLVTENMPYHHRGVSVPRHFAFAKIATNTLSLCIVKCSRTGRFRSDCFLRLRHVSRPKYKPTSGRSHWCAPWKARCGHAWSGPVWVGICQQFHAYKWRINRTTQRIDDLIRNKKFF